MEQLTFLAVHAHPDDEASSSGGLYRLLADQGVRTVSSRARTASAATRSTAPSPTPVTTTATRSPRFVRSNSINAVKILGISRLVRLGYRDSGMMGWPQNEDPESFWATPVEVAAANWRRS